MTPDSLPFASERQPSQRAVLSAELFVAMVEDMAKSLNVDQVEARRTTIKHYFLGF